MKDPNIQVSVIVPCYNYGHFVGEALESLLAQTFSDWECIIVNDGSTDDSQAVIEAFIKDDPRFKLINTPNSGVSSARNTAVAHARGVYLFPLDADNRLHAECLEKCVSEFRKRPGTKLVYSEVELFGAETGLWNLAPFDYKTMLKYNMVDNSALFLREDFNRIGGYRTNMVYGLEDWDFFIALLYGCTSGQVIKLSQPLYYYRVNTTGRRMTVEASGRQKDMLDLMVYNNFAIYKEYFPEIFTRIHAYDYSKTMLGKSPVKLVVDGLNRLSVIRSKFSGRKK